MTERKFQGKAPAASGKKLWIEPTMEVIASVSDVSTTGTIDIDEDFTGNPLSS